MIALGAWFRRIPERRRLARELTRAAEALARCERGAKRITAWRSLAWGFAASLLALLGATDWPSSLGSRLAQLGSHEALGRAALASAQGAFQILSLLALVGCFLYSKRALMGQAATWSTPSQRMEQEGLTATLRARHEQARLALDLFDSHKRQGPRAQARAPRL